MKVRLGPSTKNRIILVVTGILGRGTTQVGDEFFFFKSLLKNWKKEVVRTRFGEKVRETSFKVYIMEYPSIPRHSMYGLFAYIWVARGFKNNGK